jgi:hypothetical protein
MNPILSRYAQRARRFFLRARALLLCGLLVLTRASGATDQVPLKGAFNTIHSDTFGFDQQLGPIVSVAVAGDGQLSHLGRATCFTDDQFVELATGGLTATYTYVAANDDALIMEVAGETEIDFATQTVIFSGVFAISGGSGRFTNAAAVGMFRGWAVFEDPFGLPTNHGPGYFEIDGQVSSPGALHK